MKDRETVKEQFAEVFTEPDYDGSYHTPLAESVRESFIELTGGCIVWTQVHGDFKNVVKRGLFEPYPHWAELYRCCRTVIEGHAALNTQFCGDHTRARIMGEAMALLRAKYGHNAPKFWLPIMNRLRATNDEKVHA